MATMCASIVQQAQADGFTGVVTAGGVVPIEQFHLRDALGMRYESGRFLSPARPATAGEREAWIAKGGADVINLQARDVWALTV